MTFETYLLLPRNNTVRILFHDIKKILVKTHFNTEKITHNEENFIFH